MSNVVSNANPSPSRSTNADVLETLVALAAHIESELDEALAASRLSRPSFLVLAALGEAPDGALPQRELLARVRRTAGTISVRLARLSRAGFIERDADPADRRAANVRITDAGRRRLAAARELYEKRVARLTEPLEEQELASLSSQLGGWLAFFEPGEQPAPRLGVAVAPWATARRMRRAVGLPDHAGVLVLRVGRNGAAAAAGIARGDLITAAAGREVRTVADLDRALRGAGGEIVLGVLRGAEPLELDVALG
jgi:DNA-binding MarR family transcriptional regulator